MFVLLVTLLASTADAPTVMFQKAVHKNGGLFVQFQVENLNKQAIHYVGYTPESYSDGIPAGEIRPIYLMEVRQNNTAWKNMELGHCATGRGVLPLDAQGKVIFDTVIPDGDWTEFRVGLSWSNDPKAKGAVAWSRAIKREALKANKP